MQTGQIALALLLPDPVSDLQSEGGQFFLLLLLGHPSLQFLFLQGQAQQFPLNHILLMLEGVVFLIFVRAEVVGLTCVSMSARVIVQRSLA